MTANVSQIRPRNDCRCRPPGAGSITVIATAVLLLVAASTSHAATRTWTGGPGNWSADGNWDTLVPSNGDDVVIPDSGSDRLMVVDVQGRLYHATTGANLPAAGTLPDSNAQMYMIMADVPIINTQYTNMNDMGGGLTLLPTARWRGNPNDSFRTMDEAVADFADFASKYQLRDAGPNTLMHNNRDTTEADLPLPETSFDLPDLDGVLIASGPLLYIAHDTDTARPTWLSGSFTDTGKDLATDGENPTWDVFSREVTSYTSAVGNSTGWISDGAALDTLTINQATAGVTQVLHLAHNLSVAAPPTYNVSAGGLRVEVGSYIMRLGSGGTIPADVTVTLDGGEYGKEPGDVSTGSLTITGTLSGVGTVNPGRGDLTVTPAGTIAVGDGVLAFNFPFGNTFSLDGALTGNGTTSTVYLGYNLPNGQLKGIATVGAGAVIQGIAEIRMFAVDNTAGNLFDQGFGRFADADAVDLNDTLLEFRGANNNNRLPWEVQTTSQDVAVDPPAPAFRLDVLSLPQNGDLRLVDSGAVADDFAYIGDLAALNSSRYVDINDLALVTDMTATALQALVDSSAIVNNGALGAPVVKSVDMGPSGLRYYVAPASIDVPEPVLGLTCAELQALVADLLCDEFAATQPTSLQGLPELVNQFIDDVFGSDGPASDLVPADCRALIIANLLP